MSAGVCNETNPIGPGFHDEPITAHVDWTEPGLRVERLRLLSDPGHPSWDVSYCLGRLDGKRVAVSVPFSYPGGLLKPRNCRGWSLARQIVAYAIKDGVNAKRLGILDCISTLN
jgi:hypothetical protein